MEPTSCLACRQSLEHRGHVTYYDAEMRPTRHLCLDCDRQERLDRWPEGRILTTSLVMDATLACYRGQDGGPVLNQVWQDTQAVQDAIPRFDRLVWQGGLRRQMVEARWTGWSRREQDFTFMAFTTAGRYLFTLESLDASITLITIDDDRARMGLQGICATRQEALDLMEHGIGLWQKYRSLERDPEVRVL